METVAENLSKTYTIAEYLAMEERASEKHEFYNGNVVTMPGDKFSHNLIATNITTSLNIQLSEKEPQYFVLNSDMKIFIPHTAAFVYPDAVVVCEKPVFYEKRNDVILNPILIVEVLSFSTEAFDRKEKFSFYKQIPSFKEYVLVEQKLPFITASFKIAERTWKDTIAEGTDASIHLQSIDCTITLSKIYKGVQFDT